MRFGFLLSALCLTACASGETSLAEFVATHSGAEILPVEFVKQREPADCGAAALTSVSRYWGVDLAPGSILTHWAPANRAFGYSIGELRQSSTKLGLSSARLLESPDYVLGVVDQGMPVIAPIAKPYERRDIFDFMLASMLSRLIVEAFVGAPPTFNHYVVVLGADDRLVYVLDPQDGYRAMSRADFLARWSDLTLKFVPDAGANVAAFVAYREEPRSALDGAPALVVSIGAPTSATIDGPPGFVAEFAGADFSGARSAGADDLVGGGLAAPKLAAGVAFQ